MTRETTRVLGLAGGVASGKSTVAEMFERLGAAVIDADRIGHEMLRRGEVKEALRRKWGERIFDEGGEIDRSRVAELVFGDPVARRFLNGVVHPPIRRRIREEIERRRAEGAPLIVLDAALLFEGGLNEWCDTVAFVRTGLDHRSERAARDRRWSSGEVERRERAQMGPDEKMSRCDLVIDNRGEREWTFEQVRRIYERLSHRVSDTDSEACPT